MSKSNYTEQVVETVTPLGVSGTFTGAAKDCSRVGRFGVSVYVERDTVDTNVDVFIENSDDGVTFRQVEDPTNLVVAAGNPDELNKTFVPTRRFMRFRLVNNTANALAATEGISTIGPQ